jgi:hypothetical protein
VADDSRSLILAGIAELDEAEPDYRKAHRYAKGNVEEFFASPRLRRALERSGTTFKLNLSKKAITSVTDRLELAAISVPGSGNDAAEKFLRQVWDDNEMPLELPVAMRKTCEYGDGYFFLWQSDDADTEHGITIDYSSPLTTRAIYDDEQTRKISYVIKRWYIGTEQKDRSKQRQRVNLYFFGDSDEPGHIEKWVTREGTNGTDVSHWEEYEENGEPWPLSNPFGPIVFHLRTDRPYGVPLHIDTYGAQDAVNKLTIVWMNTVDHHGAPQRYALLEGATENSEDDDFDDYVPDGSDPAAATYDPNLPHQDSPTAKMETGPGTMLLLKNTKATGQYDPASADAFMKPADFFVRMMAVTSDTPLHLYDPSGNQPSGESRRSADGTLTKKVDWLILSFTATISAMCRQILAMGDYKVPRVDVRFTPPEQVDDLDFWQTAKAKIDAGVSVRQALLEGGYTGAQVDEWLKSTDEENVATKIGLMAQVAVMLRDLGTASQLGLITPEQVNAIIASVMPINDNVGSEDAE